MPADRFFLSAPLDVSSVSLMGSELHHLQAVMRARIGDSVEVVNGSGDLALCKVAALGKEEAILHVLSYRHENPGPEIVLVQALTRPSNLDWIVEKGTELGASAFWLFPGENSEKKELSDNQKERLKNIALSAVKQSGRLYLPKIELKPKLSQWQPLSGSLLFGDLAPEAKKIAPPLALPLYFFVGPEKGFSAEEASFLRENLSAQGVKLHGNTLRAETAAIAALSQLFVCLE